MTLRRSMKFSWVAIFIAIVLAPFEAAATGPISEGLAGAVRSGIGQEAALGNPAALGLLNQSFVRGAYGRAKMADREAGGRTLALGVYDGQNPNVRAGVEYVRDSRAISFRGMEGYRDRSEVRLAMGRQVWGSVLGGATVRRLTVRDGGPEEKVVNVDVGVIFPITADVRMGLLAENVAKSQREAPSRMGGGLAYLLGGGVTLRADLGNISSGDRKGQKFWSAAAEVTIIGDVLLRGGAFHDPYSDNRGQTLGMGWIGPRASLDYAFVKGKNSPMERRHIVAMTVSI